MIRVVEVTNHAEEDRLCLSRFEPEGKMGIVPDEVLFCVFYCCANDTAIVSS
jgi:hypothetical protein